MIKEKPILFNTEMVRAVLAGNKTETRRVIKSPAKSMQESGSKVIQRNPDNDSWYKDRIWSMRMKGGTWGDYTHERFLEFCPYGVVGDRLWVRETFCLGRVEAIIGDYGMETGELYIDQCEGQDTVIPKEFALSEGICTDEVVWKPSIFMFRKDSRINLEITDIRVERVQDISADGAIKEGCNMSNHSMPTLWFKTLWDSINEKRDGGVYSWDKNPWVWVVEFKLIEGA